MITNTSQLGCFCRFAEGGASVVLWDINKDGNKAVAEEIKAKGQTACAYVCDCSKKDDIYRVAEKVGGIPQDRSTHHIHTRAPHLSR